MKRRKFGKTRKKSFTCRRREDKLEERNINSTDEDIETSI
jgi:hypothetical protein